MDFQGLYGLEAFRSRDARVEPIANAKNPCREGKGWVGRR